MQFLDDSLYYTADRTSTRSEHPVQIHQSGGSHRRAVFIDNPF